MILSPMIYKELPIFDHTQPRINKAAYNFPELYQHAENQFIPLIHS